VSERRYSAQQVADAIREARGFVTVAAEKLGCHRATVQRYINDYATVKEAVEDSREKRHDYVENKLMSAINDGNVTAIIFYLKTQCKDRGYVERTEHTGEAGGAIRIEYVNDWRANADDSAT
jgi:hypothetical protein